MPSTSTTKAHLALLAANLLFGINFSVVKVIAPDLILPLGLNFMRVLVATSLFWLLFLFHRKNGGILKKDIPRFILCAITGIAINQILFIKGLVLTTPIHAALLILGTPVFILILSFITGTEKLSSLKIWGLITALAGGVVLVLSKESSALGSNILLGDIFVLVNAISYAVYMLLVKPLMQHYSPIQVTRWVFTFGLFIILPFCWKDFSVTDWKVFTPGAWAALSLVVMGATFFAYLFIAYGIHHLSPSITGAYIYTQPVFSAGIAIIFLNEEPALYKLLAAILIFTGVYLITRRKTSG
ncbi:MAG: DMT family transporter [Bacteroidota bacterium]|jgi:drug/metabolite transporter (DMT)-like permease